VAQRTSLSLLVVLAKRGLVLLVDHQARVLLVVAIVLLHLAILGLLLVLFEGAILAVRVGLRRRFLAIVVGVKVHVLGNLLLHGIVLGVSWSLLHLRHGCARHWRLVGSEGHGSEELLLLALNGRVREVVSHNRDNWHEVGLLALRLGDVMLRVRHGWWLGWLSIEQLVSVDWLSLPLVILFLGFLGRITLLGVRLSLLLGSVVGLFCLHFLL